MINFLVLLLCLCVFYIAFLKSISIRRFIRKKRDKFARKDGYKKQVIAHTIYIGFVILVFFGFYFYWYFNLPLSDKKVTFITSLFQFFESNGGFVSFYFGFTALLLVYLSFKKNTRNEEYGVLYSKSKEKIKVLNNFSKQFDLIGNRSIYHSIISLLKRCDENRTDTGSLKLLLCSPLIDFKERAADIDEWGYEFSDLLKNIAVKKNIEVELYHLPNKVILGSNPLKSFTEILANYISTENVLSDFITIWRNTEEFIESFDRMDKSTKSKVTFNRTVLTDVPFQIVLYKSKQFSEVVVSFAGKKNLEDIKVNEPYGFHSVDTDVVEAFTKIYESYVQESRKSPIKPQHSLDIIEKTNQKGKHSIKDYLNSSLFQNLIDNQKTSTIKLEIPEKTFSPAFANSSKFTSLVLKSILGKDDKVLEIGAGSGVQSIVAYKTLQLLGNKSPKVYALEVVDEAFNSLNHNLNLNELDSSKTKNPVITLKGELKSIVSEYDFDSTKKVFHYLEDGSKKISEEAEEVNSDSQEQEIYNDQLNAYTKEITGGCLRKIGDESNNNTNFKFLEKDCITFLIADLPYVDTTSDNSLQRAFFDSGHYAHKALFLYFGSSARFSSNARLLTSFSTLGGIDDIVRFELLIKETGLYINHKQAFYEDGYEWIVYSIHKKSDFNWQLYLNAKEV